MSEASESEIGHVKWPSFKNIHRYVAEERLPEAPVLALEKIDGSNLGIEVSLGDGLIALHGRSSILWHKGMQEDPFERKYGSVQTTMEALADYIPRLQRLTEALSVAGSIVVYGEWYKNHLERTAAAGRFPFGLFERESGHFQTMTYALYQTFVDHELQPPKILFCGSLGEAIDTLLPIMLDPPTENFEGVFFTRAHVSGTRVGMKWKTGPYEEQPRWILGGVYVNEGTAPIVDKLRTVYDKKTGGRGDSQKAKASEIRAKKEEEDSEMRKQVALAFHSVMSKSPVTVEEIRGMDRERRVAELRRLNAETMADVAEQFDGVDEALPKRIEKLVGALVSKEIMRPRKK